jgi:Ca2+-binding RTX toxin-like protein
MAIVHISSLGATGGFPETLGLPRVTGGGTTATGGIFSFTQPYEQASIEYFLGESGIVTSFRYIRSVSGNNGPLFARDYLVSELNIPLSVFEANLSNLTALVVDGDDVIYGNDLDTSSGYAGRQTIKAGNGNDTIYGLGSDDALYGENDDDQLIGGSGNDALFGGAGNDILLPGTRGPEGNGNHNQSVDGGDGIDTISFEDLTTAIEVNLNVGSARELSLPLSAPRLVDVITNVENAVGGSGNDSLFGNSLANDLTGGAGNDIIYGLDGHDRLFGDAGNDRLFGGNGSDVLYGGDGNDVLRGDAGADLLNGFAGIDTASYANATIGMIINLTSGTASDGDTLTFIENITGSRFDDVLVGLHTNNKLLGGAGNDQLFGLAGNDRLEGQEGDDALFGGDGNDYQIGSAGNDGLFGEAGNDKLFGGDGDDYLAGGIGNDTILGDAGNDQIDAGAGDDIVVVGAGNDGFTLGAGDDIIQFSFGNGQDTIFDFGNGQDVIDFSATNVTLLGLQASATQTDAGVLFQDGSNSILLAGLTLSQLDWTSDFLFAG